MDLQIEHVVIAILSMLFLPILSIFGLVIVLASLGTSLGIRRRYVDLLLKIFEYGKSNIEKYKKIQDFDVDDEIVPPKTLSEDQQTTPGMRKMEHTNGDALIDRGESFSLSVSQGIHIPYGMTVDTVKREFELADVMYFARCGVEAIIDDNVTRCFTSEEIGSWNLLSRTNYGIHHINWRLRILWYLGIIFRYWIAFPFRLVLGAFGVAWLIVCGTFLGFLPYGRFRRWLTTKATLMCCRILARACSIIATYHNEENRATNGICVANHTSPIDALPLLSDNCLSMIGQVHGGILGLVQRAAQRSGGHIFFERSESRDRNTVMKRLKEHISDLDKPPILIFPEGTCINNTSVMMFKKGGFEVSEVIHPVAIKYDPRFGDAFWNSSKQTMMWHIFDILTSWALVVDIWYLPPMTKKEDEDAVDFANRVKAEIARKGGLVDLEWDGQLKRNKVKDSWKSLPQAQYSKIIKGD